MATTVSFNGSNYSIPNTAGENGWETTLTQYLQALASGAAVTSTMKQTCRVATTSPVTVQASTDFTVVCKLSSPGAVTVNLPAGATGRLFAVVDGTGDAGTNNVTIDGNGAETINGQATYVINENYGGVLLHWNGTEWSVLADFVGNDPRFSSINVSGTATVGTLAATNATVGGVAVVTTSASQALTNKTIDADTNTITNIENADIKAGAAIDRSKLASGSASHVVINDGSGVMSSEAQLATSRGGTGVNSTATFPTSGVVPTETSTSTLTNKRVSSTAAMTGALELPAGTVAQRPSPVAGHIRLNTDSNEFEGYANGTWQSVGGGVNELPLKNYLKTYTTAAVAPGTLSTLASGTANLVSLTAFYADSTSGSAALTQSSDTSLRGSFNYLTAVSGADTAGGRFFQFPAFALEGTDLGKPVSISFDVTSSIADGDWDVVVVRYNSSGVHQELIPVAGNASSSSVTPSAKLPTGRTQFRGFFVPGATSGDLYAVRFRRLVGSQQVRLDTLYVGPQPQLAGAPVTDSRAETLTASNTRGNGWTIGATTTAPSFGTTSGTQIWTRQIGERLHVLLQFQQTSAGSAGTGVYLLQLPSNLSIDTTKTKSTSTTDFTPQKVGVAVVYDGTYVHTGYVHVYDSGTVTLRLTEYTGGTFNGSTTFASTGQTTFADTNLSIYAEFSLPIANWSSNVTMAERAVEEYAADDGSADVFGPNGALVPNTGYGTIVQRDFVFQTPRQATDLFNIEVFDANGWTPAAQRAPYATQGTGNYGIKGEWISSTTYRVTFGAQGVIGDGATYGANSSTAWSSIFGLGWRWRVRKVSGGAAVGFPVGVRNITGDTSGTAVPAGMLNERLTAVNTTTNNAVFNTPYSSGTISLTPGTYDLYGMLGITATGTLSATVGMTLAVRDASATTFTGTVVADNRIDVVANNTAGGGAAVGPYRVNVTSTTTYHAVGAVYATSGTGTANLRIIANRVG